jgi:hypothetical protein
LLFWFFDASIAATIMTSKVKPLPDECHGGPVRLSRSRSAGTMTPDRCLANRCKEAWLELHFA